jgi:flagellar hook-associated protein 2
MAEGILGLGNSGSVGLNQELIDKLKGAERKAQVEPIETRLEDWDIEVEQFGEIEAKVNELLTASKGFDLFNTSGTAFDKVYASTSGTSVSFDATDTSNLKPGTINVNVTQVAQKDVFQSGLIADKTETMDAGLLSINVGGDTLDFDTTGKTYEQVVASMNNSSKLDVALEKVSDSEYRMIIKSAQSGLDNSMRVTQNGGLDIGLGNTYASQASDFVGANTVANGEEINFSDGTNSFAYTSDGTLTYQQVIDNINATGNFTASLVDGEISVSTNNGNSLQVTDDTMFGLQNSSQTQTAQNMNATIDGIEYNTSSNQVVLQSGLTVSAIETGTSSISIQRDTSNIETTLQEMITQYNELADMVSEYTISADSKIEDKSTLRSILSQVKDIMFGSDYGTNDDKSLFNYGISLDKTGHLTLDSATFNTAVVEELDELKSLLVGVAEDKGIGTKLKEYLDELDSFDGLLTSYGDSMSNRKASLEEEKTKAIESLDAKYLQLANQFAAYTAIINQFESSFGGLKMMIQQSTSG